MKRTELKRKTPLRARSTPPKQREPMKRSRKASKSAVEKRHLDRVAQMPCILCKRHGPSTVHHVRHKITRSGTFARVDRRVVPLCPSCHQHDHGKESVERVHEAGIHERWGVDLWAEAERLWAESQAIEASR